MFLTRVGIVLATMVIMISAVFAVVALHVFKLFWRLSGSGRKRDSREFIDV